mgnify:CR=1 FL=1
MPHGLRPLRARDPHEHRAATTLELFYDLTIVVAFSVSGGQFAHSLAAGHVLNGVAAFAFTVFAVTWAWASFTTFASGFDNDDVGMRLATLAQMAGIVVLTLGIPDLYHGFDEWHLDNRILVYGYVTMRASMMYLWWRAAKDNPERRPVMKHYIRWVGAAQVGWVALTFVHAGWAVTGPALLALYGMEVYAVLTAQRSNGSPWNVHHLVERYGLLTIISLGEVVLGTTVAVQAVIESQHEWNTQSVLLLAAGITMAFGMWWTYFALPYVETLSLHPERVFGFAQGHLAMFGTIAGVGAGLHAVAYFIEGETELSQGATMLTVAVPMGLFIALVYGIAHYLMPGRDRFHWILGIATVATLAASVALSYAGVSLGWSLIVLMLAPWINVVGYETAGHGHLDRVLERMRGEAAASAGGGSGYTRGHG